MVLRTCFFPAFASPKIAACSKGCLVMIWYLNVGSCAGSGSGSGVNDLSFTAPRASFLSLPYGRETLLDVVAAFRDGVTSATCSVVDSFQPHPVATCDNHIVNVSVSSLY
jgi:hypothetical protein